MIECTIVQFTPEWIWVVYRSETTPKIKRSLAKVARSKFSYGRKHLQMGKIVTVNIKDLEPPR